MARDLHRSVWDIDPHRLPIDSEPGTDTCTDGDAWDNTDANDAAPAFQWG